RRAPAWRWRTNPLRDVRAAPTAGSELNGRLSASPMAFTRTSKHAAELPIIKARPDLRSGREVDPPAGRWGVGGPKFHPFGLAAGPVGGRGGARSRTASRIHIASFTFPSLKTG